jgi:hypothetical protein
MHAGDSRARVGEYRRGAVINDDPEDWNDEEDWGDYFDRGMDRDGNCGKAGSEECDWECPYAPRN